LQGDRPDAADPAFDDWGIPTAESLVAVRAVVEGLPLIASGGIRSGIEMAKAIALGASYAGMALPLVGPAAKSSGAVKDKIRQIIQEFKIAMFSCGARNLEELKKGQHIRKLP
ncbi:MAG: alpha-hydroxy-acid oxidizing protein, partial [Desulfobacterales bacterium]|nr:alpha-hydroxy-acid oxidizing protein [Desulfobacterales bacterium]